MKDSWNSPLNNIYSNLWWMWYWYALSLKADNAHLNVTNVKWQGLTDGVLDVVCVKGMLVVLFQFDEVCVGLQIQTPHWA